MDARVERTMSGAVWNEFCHGLTSAGEVVLRPEVPGNWIALDPDAGSHQRVVRQTFADWARDFQAHPNQALPLDDRDHRIDLNGEAAKPESDGRIRIVVAHRDPGHPNRIETADHARGTMGLRIVKRRETREVSQGALPVGAIPPFSGRR
ncbi:hypothetical protein K2X89_07055 [Myxococcota bacterium]|nr:hypothetical protein [Myxococcota bacterium]